jgi:RNA polymerase sigma factor (TIGR02999 family)
LSPLAGLFVMPAEAQMPSETHKLFSGRLTIEPLVDSPRTVTMLLRDWRAGNRAAFDELVPMVYAELELLAAKHMRGERPGHTFRPNDLVSEAYLRLASIGETPEWSDRCHFFAIAARTMRQILVEHARKRAAAKRGAGVRPVTFEEALATTERPEAVVALDDALKALAEFDERKARTIELHFFGGLTQNEIAEVLQVHVNTVAKDLRLAQAWIYRRLQKTDA